MLIYLLAYSTDAKMPFCYTMYWNDPFFSSFSCTSTSYAKAFAVEPNTSHEEVSPTGSAVPGAASSAQSNTGGQLSAAPSGPVSQFSISTTPSPPLPTKSPATSLITYISPSSVSSPPASGNIIEVSVNAITPTTCVLPSSSSASKEIGSVAIAGLVFWVVFNLLAFGLLFFYIYLSRWRERTPIDTRSYPPTTTTYESSTAQANPPDATCRQCCPSSDSTEVGSRHSSNSSSQDQRQPSSTPSGPSPLHTVVSPECSGSGS